MMDIFEVYSKDDIDNIVNNLATPENISNINAQLADIMQVDFNKYGSTANSDNTPALTSIINDAISKGYTSIEITIPTGIYIFTTPFINSAVMPITFKGQGRFNSIFLWRGGSGTFLTNNDVNDWIFEDMQITGYKSGDSAYFTPGTIGIKPKGNLILNNVYFQGFQTLHYWNGAFYHKFTKSRFEKTNKVVDNAYVNNIVFDKCQVINIDNFVVASAGLGPLTIDDCSFENWTTTLFSTTGGATPQLITKGCYYENNPSQSAGNGLAKATYDGAFVASGFGGYSFLGNEFSTSGIRRIVNNSGVNTDTIISLGNRIDYQGDANDSLEHAFVFANLKSGLFMDYVKKTITGLTGGYTSDYISGTYANPSNCKIYDPFKNNDVSPDIPWIIPTLLNGFVQNQTAGSNMVAYRIVGNYVELKGVIDGSAATANAMFNIPNLGATKYSFKVSSTTGGTLVMTRILTNGDVRSETLGINSIVLDNLKFYID